MINRQGNLVVRAPKRASLIEIEKFVRVKQSWIQEKSAQMRQRRPVAKAFVDGEKFLFLGQEYQLRIIDDYRSKLDFDGSFAISKYFLPKARRLFEEWYRRQARELLERRANFYEAQMGVVHRRLSITAASSRWGSCSSKATVNFSWRLIMAPMEVVDYVVVHELSHMLHHNHSGKFWLMVGRFCPDFRSAKFWLDRHGHRLAL